MADEETRTSKLWTSTFKPAIAIPPRPCRPARPDAYMGPTLDTLSVTTNFPVLLGASGTNTVAAFKNVAYLASATDNNSVVSAGT